MKTKKAMYVATALLAGLVGLGAAQAMTLAEARGRIDKVVANAGEMKSVMKQLSAGDQKAYLAEVNAAIAKMPASGAERTSAYVAANRAALEGAQKGNVTTLLAEMFATVELASLPALTESLSGDLMNRATAKGQTYTDAQYAKLSEAVMAKVNARTADVDRGDVRSGFAALMLIRGSNSREPAIVDPIVAALPAAAQEVAKKEWFPAALAEGQAKSYDPMLAAANVEEVGEDGSHIGTVALHVTGPQLADSLLSDITGANVDPTVKPHQKNPLVDAELTTYAFPAALTAEEATRDAAIGLAILESRGELEPRGYPGQTRH